MFHEHFSFRYMDSRKHEEAGRHMNMIVTQGYLSLELEKSVKRVTQ